MYNFIFFFSSVQFHLHHCILLFLCTISFWLRKCQIMSYITIFPVQYRERKNLSLHHVHILHQIVLIYTTNEIFWQFYSSYLLSPLLGFWCFISFVLYTYITLVDCIIQEIKYSILVLSKKSTIKPLQRAEQSDS